MAMVRKLPVTMLRSSLISQAAFNNAYRGGYTHPAMSPFLRSRSRGRSFQSEFRHHFKSRRRFFGTSTELFASETTDESAKEQNSKHEEHAVQLKELHEQIDDLTDRYKRSLAENENLRNRLNHKERNHASYSEQIEEARIYGIQSFCKDLLDVSDVLSKAIETSGETSLADLLKGLELTKRELQQVFHRHGLVPEDPMGAKFDPHKHEALFQMTDPNVEPGTVVQVQKIGYLLHGRTVRPALVAVSKK